MKNQDLAWKEFLLVEVASLCEIISLLGKHRKCRKLKKRNPKKQKWNRKGESRWYKLQM